MKSTILSLAILVLFAGIISCKTTPADTVQNNSRLIHNNDGTEILGNNWFGNRPLTLADLNQYVDMVAASQVTTFMICSGSDFFYYRSKYGRLLGDDKNGSLNCGTDTALAKVLQRCYQNAMILDKQGTDIIEASLKRAREKKLETFITFRMNDLHFADTTNQCSLKYSDYWIAHPEYWTNDTTLSGFNSRNALDFAHPEVRTYKLSVIKEQLEKYGSLIDGYELDFMRFIVYFKRGEAAANAPLMTALVHSARNLVDSIGKINGKKILLTARIPATLANCTEKGLDVKAWASSGLVDFLTLGVHWRGEPAMPVADFKKQLGVDLPVYATLDDGGYNPREVYSHGMYRGMASHALAQGAAGLTLFNYFLTEYNKANQQLMPEQGTAVCRIIAPELLQELGSLETLKKRNKIYALSDGATSYSLTPNSPLPLKIYPDNKASIFVGDDVQADEPKEIVLFVRASQADSFAVSINGHNLSNTNPEYPKLYDRLRGIKDNQKVWAFIVPAKHVIKGDNTIAFSTQAGEMQVQRIELLLNYGPVAEHGYF